jgi:DNA polymerase-3 subunit gamma/tau
MVAAVGCPADTFLYASTASSGNVVEAGQRLGLQTILAVMQILDQALSRMKYSTQARILAELALVRICHLEDLEELSSLIVQLQGAASGEQGAGSRGGSSGPARTSVPPPPRSGPETHPAAAKKKYEPVTEPPAARQVESTSSAPRSSLPAPRSSLPAPRSPLPTPRSSLPTPLDSDEDDDSPAEAGFVLDTANVGETWRRAIEKIPGMVGEQAKKFSRLDVSGMNRVTVFFSPENALCKTGCQRPEQVLRFEQALKDVTGQVIRIEFKLLDAPPQATGASPHQRLLEAASHPLVRRASELFGAQPTQVD